MAVAVYRKDQRRLDKAAPDFLEPPKKPERPKPEKPKLPKGRKRRRRSDAKPVVKRKRKPLSHPCFFRTVICRMEPGEVYTMADLLEWARPFYRAAPPDALATRKRARIRREMAMFWNAYRAHKIGLLGYRHARDWHERPVWLTAEGAEWRAWCQRHRHYKRFVGPQSIYGWFHKGQVASLAEAFERFKRGPVKSKGRPPGKATDRVKGAVVVSGACDSSQTLAGGAVSADQALRQREGSESPKLVDVADDVTHCEFG